jgi:hypothetical protein
MSGDDTSLLKAGARPGAGANHPERMMPACAGGAKVTSTGEIKEGDMASTQSSGTTFQLRSGSLILGAALIGAAWVLGLIGLTICSSTVIAATRKWVKQMDTPPSELARLKWEQAKAATAAGTSAWQDGVTTGHRS